MTGKMTQPRVHIEPGHGTSRGRRRGARARQRRTSSGKSDRPTPQPTVIQRLRAGAHRVLVRATTHAENTHALRAQLRAAGLRLLGDLRGDRPPRRESSQDTCLHLTRIAFHHPQLKRKLTLQAAPPPAFAEVVEGNRDVERMLQTALIRRLACLLDETTDAYGLLLGSVEGVRGLNAEKLGPVVVLQVLDERRVNPELQRRIGRWYRKTLGSQAVYLKHLSKRDSPGDPAARQDFAAKPLLGRATEPQIVVREGGLRLGIRPYDGMAVGLYLDQRDNRARVRSLAPGKDVLNLFAYTCGFSLAAAAGGARSTVSVDISTKHLEWGKENFALNELTLTDHQFIRSEALDYFKRARRKERSFDLIILDPPTFAHSRKSKATFQLERDLPALLTEALTVLRPRGMLMISTNYRKISRSRLEEYVKDNTGGRRARVIDRPGLPPDYAADRAYAKTIFVRLD